MKPPAVNKTFNDRIYKLMRSLERHKERYIRAWMAHYGLHPAVCHIVMFPKTAALFGDERGEVMRMECRADPDKVAELVKAARVTLDRMDAGEFRPRVREALKPFEP